MELPLKKEINKDPAGLALKMLGISLEKLERVKSKVAEEIAELLAYQWGVWSPCLKRKKKTRLRQDLSSLARIVLERTGGRTPGEEIHSAEIAAFMGRKI